MTHHSIDPKQPFMNIQPEHPFAIFVRAVGKGKKGRKDLTREEAYQAFTMILKNEVEPEQLGAFMMLLRVKEETAEELLGFVQATKDHLPLSKPNTKIDIDWSSYAGKKRQYPWYILTALTLAQHGFNVVMHGASGHTEHRIYSETVIEYLNLPIAHTTADIDAGLASHHFVYVPLSAFSPRLADIINLRQVFGLRSPVHTLARLINPFDATYSLQSIFHPAYRGSHHEASIQLGYQNSLVIKGDGGEFERNPDATTLMLGTKHGEPYQMEWQRLNDQRSPDETAFDLELFEAVWLGTQSHDYGEKAIIGTLALILIMMNQASEQAEATLLAKHMWDTRFSKR